MPMCDVIELVDYWIDHPPEHVVLAAVHLNRKPKEKPAGKEELMAAISQFGGQVRTSKANS